MFFIFVPAFCAFECGNEWTLLHRYVSMCNAFHLIYCPMIYSHEIKPSGKKINRPTIRVLICIKLLYPTTITITKYAHISVKWLKNICYANIQKQ